MNETTTTADPPADTPAAELDVVKLEAWRMRTVRDTGVTNTVTLHALDKEEVGTVGDVLDVYDGWEPAADDPFTKKTFALSGWQVGDLRERLRESAVAAGLDPLAVCPWLAPEAADVPTVVEGEPPTADPLSPEALAEYDQETARLVTEAEAEVSELEAVWEEKHGEAALAKKEFENTRDKMRSLIRERTANRGKKDLFTGVKGGIVVGESPADPAAPSEDRLYELSQLYPLDFAHWEEFGLTAKDVEKLNEGVTKHHGTIPLRTLGDVARYTKPSADGYERRLVDVKGFGPGAFERWEAANLAFWAAWPNGKAVQFAAEIGFDLGTQGTADASQPDAGSGDGAAGGDGEAAAGEGAPAAEQPPERLRRNEKTGELETAGEEKPKRKRKKAA